MSRPQRKKIRFTGADIAEPNSIRTGHDLLVHDGLIEAIIPRAEDTPSHETVDASGLTLSPGFIDIQVNGGGGVLFNDDPTIRGAQAIFDAHHAFGTTAILPTLITGKAEALESAIESMTNVSEKDAPGLIGLHLEGPFLNKAKKGIHDEGFMRPPSRADLKGLLGAKIETLLVTLAPEVVGPQTIRILSDNGIHVAAGHTKANYQQTRDALDAGLSGFTHLFNAMPPMLSRDPGPVAAALESEAWCGIIADGHHVHEAALRLALSAKADGRMILVTDAMPTVGTDDTSFALGDRTITLDDGRLTGTDGTLAGSALTMIDAVRFAVTRLGQPLHRALAMASSEPAAFLGRQDSRGIIAPGRRADLCALDDKLQVVDVTLSEKVEKFLSSATPPKT